uniref:Uncharacterized protein n=1 Tax=Anguilla anguilla TaxID=7936 RepID=A0A0E9TQI3_ANGAN
MSIVCVNPMVYWLM